MARKPSIGVGTFFQVGKKRTWYFEHKGAGIRASLGTTDSDQAEREALARFGYLRFDQRTDRLEQAVVLLDVARRHSEEARRERIPLEVEGIWTAYEEQLALVSRTRLHDSATTERPLSANYLRQQRCSLVRVLKAYDGQANCMHEVTEAEAQRTFARIVRDGSAPASINRYLSDMRTIWDRLAARTLSSNPWQAVQKRKKGELARTRKGKRPFTEEETDDHP